MKGYHLVLVFLLAPSLCLCQNSEQSHSAEHYHGQDGHYHHSNDGRGWDIRLSVPGEPQVDYPTLNDIPKTSFNCIGKNNGYYADPETRCQVFRVCTTTGPSGFYSFLCPNGTLFNTEVHVCDWWMNVKCPADDSEIISSGKLQVNPRPQMLQDVKKMIMYPMSHPLPFNYPRNEMTMQVYNPPTEMISMFISPPKDTEGQQILGEERTPDSLPPGPHHFSTAIKHDSFTSGTTSFDNKPIVVKDYQGIVANTPSVQDNLHSKYIEQQAEILQLQKQYNANLEHQSIKITKQQYTYPSQFDKEYTVTVPKVPTNLNQPFVVNIPINIPAIDGDNNLVSEQMVAEESNNLNPFKSRNESSNTNHPTTTVASIPFIILLVKPSEKYSDNNLLTKPAAYNDFYNNHQNLVQNMESREDANTNTIHYFYPHGYIKQSASYTKPPPIFYIPVASGNTRPAILNSATTMNEYKEMTVDLKNAKDFQMTEREKDLVMLQLNKHLDKQEERLTNEITQNMINNTNADNNLVTIFSAHVNPKGDKTDDKVLKLCIPKEALIYLLRVHNATKQALERHTSKTNNLSNYQNSNRYQSMEEKVHKMMEDVLQNNIDRSDQQVPIVNDAELYRKQQVYSFQRQQGTLYKNTNEKVVNSVSGSRTDQGGNYQNVPFVTGTAQTLTGTSLQSQTGAPHNVQSNTSYKTGDSKSSLKGKENQQNGFAVNQFSAKFNKNQLTSQTSEGHQIQSQNGLTTAAPEDEKYDQYRITSSIDGPKTIVDEENRGEFFSLQHYRHQQKIKPVQQTFIQNSQQQNADYQSSNYQKSNNQNTQTGFNQQNNDQKLNSFAVRQKPMPFSRTSNSPPGKNDNNRILNHNMAGFINNQQSQIQQNSVSNAAEYAQTVKQTPKPNNPQGTVYSYSQEYSKTVGPTVSEYNQQHTKFVQNGKGYPQQTQSTLTQQQNLNQHTIVNSKTTTGQQGNIISHQRVISPNVNTQNSQTLVRQNNVSPTTSNPPAYYEQQKQQSQQGGTSQSNGFTNSAGYTYTQGTLGSQNVDGYKYNQVLSIQKQLGGSNTPTPFTKQGIQSGNERAQAAIQNKQQNSQNYFAAQNVGSQNVVTNQQQNAVQNQNGFYVPSKTLTPNTNNQQFAQNNNRQPQFGIGFITSTNQNTNNEQSVGVTNNQNSNKQVIDGKPMIGFINAGGIPTGKQINAGVQYTNYNGASNMFTGNQFSNRQAAIDQNVGNEAPNSGGGLIATRFEQSDFQQNQPGFQITPNLAAGISTTTGVADNTQFIAGTGISDAGVNLGFQQNQGGYQGGFQVNTGIGSQIPANTGPANTQFLNRAGIASTQGGFQVNTGIGSQIPANTGPANTQFLNRAGIASTQGGFQVNTGIGSQIPANTGPANTQFLNRAGIASTQGGGGTNVEVVPSYGFALDSDRERNYYLYALQKNLKDVDKVYLPPYDEATADFMVSEINRQAQLGQFTPMTFQTMFNAYNGAPNFAVQNMMATDDTFGNGAQSSFGLQFNGNADTVNNIQKQTENQEVTITNNGGNDPDQTTISVDNFGYPRERPKIPFTF